MSRSISWAATGLVMILSGSAQSMHLSPSGMGEALIYPYYTVNGGHDTLLSVVNTTRMTKALRVRLHAAQPRDQLALSGGTRGVTLIGLQRSGGP